MATNTLTPQSITRDGITPSYATLSTADTNVVVNDGRLVLHFKKDGAGACTVTFVSQATLDGLAVTDPTVSVASGTGDVMIGPFSRTTFNNTSGQLVFTIDEATGLTVGAFQLP